MAIPRKIKKTTLVSTASSILKTAAKQERDSLVSMQMGKSSLSVYLLQSTPEQISTVLSLRLKTIFRSTIQLAPSKNLSKVQMPRQTSPVCLFLRRKYRSGNQLTILPSISISILGNISSKVCCKVFPQATSIFTHFNPFCLAILHWLCLNAQAFSISCSIMLYSFGLKQVKVEPESMNSPYEPRVLSALRIVSFIRISPTLFREYRFLSPLKVVLTGYMPLVISLSTLPMANCPPFLAKHKEKRNSSPVNLLCFSQSMSKSRAFL